MKKTFTIFGALCLLPVVANASRDVEFKNEITRGLPVVQVQYNSGPDPMYYNEVTVINTGINTIAPDTEVVDMGMYGCMECGTPEPEIVYEAEPVAVVEEPEEKVFIPTRMYLRMGGGFNLSMATKKARVGDDKFKTQKSWNTTIGLGWNLRPFLRTEVAFQESRFEFNGVPHLHASYHTLNGMVYFDIPPRYKYVGDTIQRRNFVPFLGLGGGIGQYEFIGPHGADGLVIIAPRAEAGMNFRLTDVIGIDVAYQYQMFLGHGFGWNTKRIGLDGVSNIMATMRVNF